jgi:hypothetical protein
MRKEKRTEEGWRKKKEYTLKWLQDLSIEKRLLYSARTRAKKNGLVCTITEDDIIVPEICPILLIKMYRVPGQRQHGPSPSLDRIDNTKGYVPGNVRVISYRANTLKNNMTFQQIERLYNYVLGLV